MTIYHQKISRWFATIPTFLSLYFDRRVASIFILGIAQGLPWVMIGSMLTLWLKESGISRAEIGYATLIFTVYAINFLWSPLIDFTTPRFLQKFGRRQSWIIACQIVIAIMCFAISASDPSLDAKHAVMLALVIAIFSSTQDIAIDAYRIDSFAKWEAEKVSAAAGVITAGWWTGYAGVGAIPLLLSDHNWSWPDLYILLSIITLILCVITVLLPRPRFTISENRNRPFEEFLILATATSTTRKSGIALSLILPFVIILWFLTGSPGISSAITNSAFYIASLIATVLMLFSLTIYLLMRCEKKQSTQIRASSESLLDNTLAWLLTALIIPLREFFSRNGTQLALALLSFILIFKLGEAFLGRMSIVFYKEVGFSNTQIATYSKLTTWWLTVFFALIGGVVNAKFGLFRGLFVSGIAMAITNLLFALIALVGPDERLYALAIVLDGFAAAWSTVAFVSFISLLCNHAFSATQYALMASLGNLGRTTISSLSGQIVDWMNGNWALFFVLTTAMVIPGLTILWKLKKYVENLQDRPLQPSNDQH